jgi:hypothetical protein
MLQFLENVVLWHRSDGKWPEFSYLKVGRYVLQATTVRNLGSKTASTVCAKYYG